MHEHIGENFTGGATALGKVVFTTVVASFASLTAYLNINTEALALYLTLLLLDLITGVAAAFLIREAMTLARFYAGILSKFLLFTIPVVAAIVVKIQGDGLLWFIKWTVLVLAVSEFISIINNVQKAKGNKPLPELDAVGMITTKLRDTLEVLFKNSGGTK